MTTTAAEAAPVPDLSSSVPDAPTKRKRGRPKGSRNKPKESASPRASRTTPVTRPRVTKEADASACLIENADGSTKFTFFDESGAETLVRKVPTKGWVLDRR